MAANTESSANGEHASPQLRRAIEQAQLMALEARTHYRQAKARGAVSDDVVKDLRDAMIRLYESIKRYRDEDAIKDEWQDNKFDRINEWLSQSVSVQKQNPSRPDGTVDESVPAIQAVDPNEIAKVTSELELVAKDLGLAPAVSESTPRTEITREMMEELEEWRQQNLNQ